MSSKFYCYMEQKNEGCDYTIACGQQLFEVKGVSSIEEAKAKVTLDLLWPNGFEPNQNSRFYIDDRPLRELSILEVSNACTIDLLAAWKERQAILDQAAKEEEMSMKEALERSEYERLKAKYENA